MKKNNIAGQSNQVAHRTHNPKVRGSNPLPAIPDSGGESLPVKKTEKLPKKPIAEVRKENEELKEELKTLREKYATYGHCNMCDKHKSRDKFYKSTDPMIKSGITSICKECARKIALQVDANGMEHSPTKESCRKALYYLNKPFLNKIWDASVQESENVLSGKPRSTVWDAYAKNISMPNYVGMTYVDSDTESFVEDTSISKSNTEEDIFNDHIGQDAWDGYLRNKNEIIRLLEYDPFEKEDLADQPLLYSQLIGMVDSGGDQNDDMMRTASAISIVRGFLQIQKIDDTITKLMTDYRNIEKNSAVIKSLQESKGKISSIISSLAQDSCISLKHTKNAKKGENTWTGKLKKIKDLNLRAGEVNGFDIATCKAMQQVMDLSNASIMRQLRLDESEWSDIVADQREMIVKFQDETAKYEEICRILLRENLDIKDSLLEKGIDLEMEVTDLNELFSCFSDIPNQGESEDEE